MQKAMTKVYSNDVTDEDFEMACAPPEEEEWFHSTCDYIKVDAWFCSLLVPRLRHHDQIVKLLHLIDWTSY